MRDSGRSADFDRLVSLVASGVREPPRRAAQRQRGGAVSRWTPPTTDEHPRRSEWNSAIAAETGITAERSTGMMQRPGRTGCQFVFVAFVIAVRRLGCAGRERRGLGAVAQRRPPGSLARDRDCRRAFRTTGLKVEVARADPLRFCGAGRGGRPGVRPRLARGSGVAHARRDRASGRPRRRDRRAAVGPRVGHLVPHAAGLVRHRPARYPNGGRRPRVRARCVRGICAASMSNRAS